MLFKWLTMLELMQDTGIPKFLTKICFDSSGGVFLISEIAHFMTHL